MQQRASAMNVINLITKTIEFAYFLSLEDLFWKTKEFLKNLWVFLETRTGYKMGFVHWEINESVVEWLQSFQPNKKANKEYSK